MNAVEILILLFSLVLCSNSIPAFKENSNILVEDDLVFYAYYDNRLIHANRDNLTDLINLVKYSHNPSNLVKKIVKRNTLSLVKEKIGLNANYQIIRPRCIPLKSNNINSNPYHPSLLSFPGAEVRRGQGVTSRQEISHIRCPKDHLTNCRYSYQQTSSTTVSDSFSVSLSGTETFSKSIGTSKTSGASTSYAQSIGKSIENSISNSITVTDDVSLSKTISESLSKNHEKSSGITKTKSQESSDTNTISHETNDGNTVSTEISLSNSLTNEITNSRSTGGSSSSSRTSGTESSSSHSAGANAGVGLGPFSIGGSYNYQSSSGSSQSNTQSSESNWNNGYSNTQGSTKTNSKSDTSSKSYSVTNGNTNSKTASFSDSASDENRVSDSISISQDASRGLTQTKSDSKSDTLSQSNSYRLDDSYTSSKETSISGTLSEDNSRSVTTNRETTRSNSYTFTITQDTQFDGIAPGSCKTAICLPFVKSVVIPYECVSEEGDHELIPVEYMFIEPDQNQRAQCVFTLIDCEKRYENVFINDKLDYQMADQENSLEFGQTVEKGFKLESKNKKHSLELKSDGNLVLKQYDQVRWENGMGFFEKYKNLRLRINEKGHLIEEVQNLFVKADDTYRKNEWITVWSSAPINHNVTIGVPGLQGKREGYKLILDNYGDLSLYDSLEAIIWTATKKNKHSKGYKFPEYYLLPTNFETPRDKDEHNDIESNIALLDIDSFKSLDDNCDNGLAQDQGIQSKNGRFKLILKSNGNLVIKDGYRTMWQTSTKNLPFAKAPYKLVLNPIGDIMILDSNSNILWKSVIVNLNLDKPVSGPFELKILDTGKVILEDNNGQIVWNSWPTSETSALGSVFFTRINYFYDKCAPPITCDIRQYHWNKRMNKKCTDLQAYKSDTENVIDLKKAFAFEIINEENEKYVILVDNYNGELSKNSLEMEAIITINVKNPFYITSSNEAIYLNVNKKSIKRFDLDLNEISEIEICKPDEDNCQINGIFYDKNSDRLFVSNTGLKGVYVVDKHLESVSLHESLVALKSKYFKPRYISMLRNQLILSSMSTNMIILLDNVNEFKEVKDICSKVTNSIKSIRLYQNKYILLSCTNENYIKIFDLSFNKITKTLKVTDGSYVVDIGTDGTRIFALTNKNKFEIFE